jgi:hypothetical protein
LNSPLVHHHRRLVFCLVRPFVIIAVSSRASVHCHCRLAKKIRRLFIIIAQLFLLSLPSQ